MDDRVRSLKVIDWVENDWLMLNWYGEWIVMVPILKIKILALIHILFFILYKLYIHIQINYWHYNIIIQFLWHEVYVQM